MKNKPKIEENVFGIEKADIVIGIPTYNEADNISFVVKQVDKGLRKYFKGATAVIVNSDNNSSDNTKNVFLETKTKFPKIYISTPPRDRGKGYNLKNFFEKAKELDAKAAMTVDGDLKSINPEWVRCLIDPVLKNKYDFLTPLYNRDKYDATITNHLTYPLIYGLLGYDIRQPIGGDMGFSRKMIDYWLDQKWPESALGYGIDIFMTLNAIKCGAKLGQVDLGAKIHKPSAPKLDNMFLEVVETFFHILSEEEGFLPERVRIKKPTIACRIRGMKSYPQLEFDYTKFEKKVFSEFKKSLGPVKSKLSEDTRFHLEEMLEEKRLEIDDGMWSRIVYQLFLLYHLDIKRSKILKLLRVLYYGRVMTFSQEASDKTQTEAEEIIKIQAKQFLRSRKYLVSKI